MISGVSGHHFEALRRAAAQKQILVSGAKHSPPSSSTLVAQRADIQGFSSLRDIEYFNLILDNPFTRTSVAPDLVYLV